MDITMEEGFENIDNKRVYPENELDWINRTHQVWNNMIKPCKECMYCPYGRIVELYPYAPDMKKQLLENKLDEDREKNLMSQLNKMECKVYGHLCPAFFTAEVVVFTIREIDIQPTKKEIKLFKDEYFEKMGTFEENVRSVCQDCHSDITKKRQGKE